MLIRPARHEDFEHVADLTNHYITHTAIHFATTPQSPDELRASWAGTADVYPFLVACDESAPAGERDPASFLGFAKGYRWRERDAYARTVEVGIYISRHVQGRGLGKRLYAALLDDCRRRGFHSAIGGIALPNDASERLHQALGFVRVGVFRQVGRKFDAWHDVAFYQLVL
ncbi:MAG: N-acetyltransferase family protein [Phycisphaerales bacterium]